MFQVDEMTAVEADHLLTDRLMERRSRAGSVLSDKEVNKLVILGAKLTLPSKWSVWVFVFVT